MLAITLAAALSGCGTSSDSRVSGWLVSPGKYDVYTCPQIADQLIAMEAERQKLEGLIGRASTDASGRFVSKIAYESDYQADIGELREMHKAAAAKNCPNVPTAPADRASSSVIR